MRIYQREKPSKANPKGGSWYISATINGKRIIRTTGTTDKKLATEYGAQLVTTAYRANKLGERPSHTWGEACIDWLTNETHGKRSLEDIRAKIKWLSAEIGADKPLAELTRSFIDGLMMKLRKTGVSNSTLNRYVAEVSKIMNHARGLEDEGLTWVDFVPKYKRYTEPKGRERVLTPDEANKLAGALPVWMQELFWFTLATGLRESNARLLEWNRVDLAGGLAWVHADFAKGKRSFGIPLNADALTIIRSRKDKCDQYVFGEKGVVPCRCSNPTWYAALKKLGLEGFRWHDLRHTWASRHIQSGTPPAALQELGAWNTPSMVSRYAHLSQSYVSQYAGNSMIKQLKEAHE